MVIPVTLPDKITEELTVLFTRPSLWLLEKLYNKRINYLNN